MCHLTSVPLPPGDKESVPASGHTHELSRAQAASGMRGQDTEVAVSGDHLHEDSLVLLRKSRNQKAWDSWWMGPTVLTEVRQPRYGLRSSEGRIRYTLGHSSHLRPYKYRR